MRQTTRQSVFEGTAGSDSDQCATGAEHRRPEHTCCQDWPNARHKESRGRGAQ